MSNILQYTLSLQENLTAKLKAIGVNSDSALNKFASLEKQSKQVATLFNDMGKSVGSLREKVSLLKNERDWIPETNLTDIRAYNSEIKKLEKQITKLETINGSKFKKWGKEAFANMPGSNLISNPLVAAGAAMTYAGKSALDFDEGMAKINTTAQLTQPELANLKDKLIKMGMDSGTNLDKIPDGFEKIISQVGDTKTSIDIFDSALKGSKAGFTDIDTVAGALAQTLSIVGKENTTAAEVMDMLFAAKRVGAGEFKDFATYIPGLVASADALGIKYKEVGGMFAYMTGKGQKAEVASTLMENVFSAFGKKEVQDKMKNKGVSLFDKTGAMRDIASIMADVNAATKGMSDKKKSNWLEAAGFTDAQAKKGISVLSADLGKLKEAIDATAKPAGELKKAMEFSTNPMQNIQKAWVKVQCLAMELGKVVLAVLAPALMIIDGLLSAIVWVVTKVSEGFKAFTNALQTGNPWAWGAVLVIGVLATVMAALWLWQQRIVIQQKMQAAWTATVTGLKWLWAAATGAVNLGLLTSTLLMGGLVLAILAIVAVIGYVIYAFDGWGAAWGFLMDFLKFSWEAFKSSFIVIWLGVKDEFLTGIEFLEKAWYKLSALWDKEGSKAGLAKINSQQTERAAEILKAKKLMGEEATKALEAGKKIYSPEGLHSNGKTLSTAWGSTKKMFGLGPKVPGTQDEKTKEDNSPTQPTNDAIATGGTKNTTITIHIGKQIEKFTMMVNNAQEGGEKLREIILDEMTRAIAMSQSMAQ